MTDVVIILGSKSDKEVARKATEVFDRFGIEYTITVASAHRTPPARLAEIIETAHKTDVKAFIAIAGLSAHLPGVVASSTIKPVIGVPVNSALDGIDALLSIAQMPTGIPVAVWESEEGGIMLQFLPFSCWQWKTGGSLRKSFRIIEKSLSR